mmetsp:Transcript_20750/g.40594  ORF Transcript_20750/g.40594 Transcript_20750/m.40594 type:complete len:240 (-) Transcript_20750:556-1275(-)
MGFPSASVAATCAAPSTPVSCCFISGTGFPMEAVDAATAVAAAAAADPGCRALSSSWSWPPLPLPPEPPLPPALLMPSLLLPLPPVELPSSEGRGIVPMCHKLITSGSPRKPCAIMVASNSTQSPGSRVPTSGFLSSPKMRAISGKSRRGKRGGVILTMTTLLVFTKRTSKPSRITRTSPCHLNVLRLNFSSKARAVEVRWRRAFRGPQSCRKSSQESDDSGPRSTSARVFSCTVERKK